MVACVFFLLLLVACCASAACLPRATLIISLPPLFTVKPPLSGLAERGGRPADGGAIVRSYIITEQSSTFIKPLVKSPGSSEGIKWASLQPTTSSSLNASVVAALRSELDFAQANGWSCKLRVLAGVHSPQWLMTLRGKQPFPTAGELAGSPDLPCPRWWLPEYIDAYAALQRLLAAEFDSHPALADVVISGAMVQYAEPLIRGISETLQNGTRAALAMWTAFAETPGVDADGVSYADSKYITGGAQRGFTAADQAAIERSIVAHRAWNRTTSSFGFNPFQTIVWSTSKADISVSTNNSYTLELVFAMARLLGPRRAVVENNSIRYRAADQAVGGPQPTNQYDDMYAAFRGSGASIAYQTAQPSLIGDATKTLQWASTWKTNTTQLGQLGGGAGLIELVKGWSADAAYNTTLLKSVDAALRANVAKWVAG